MSFSFALLLLSQIISHRLFPFIESDGHQAEHSIERLQASKYGKEYRKEAGRNIQAIETNNELVKHEKN